VPTDPQPLPRDLQDTVTRALAEDLGSGDVTSSLLSPQATARARVVSRESAVLCGTAWFDEVFRQLDPAVAVTWLAGDGDRVSAGQTVCELTGPVRALLSGERTALNLLQTLSGTATAARRYADAVAHTRARVLDTRKTLPGLRSAQKYATRCGGCQNHRMGLYDAILIKENHILAAGSITEAITRARARHPHLSVEVEVEGPGQLDEALAAGADIVLLDNFDLDGLRAAVARTAGRARLEASGNIDLANLSAVAGTGVDYVSVGAITKHLRAVDLSMRFLP
jgi:nicotinate-nucleotide pyrophosphorylase (carboxylating)